MSLPATMCGVRVTDYGGLDKLEYPGRAPAKF